MNKELGLDRKGGATSFGSEPYLEEGDQNADSLRQENTDISACIKARALILSRAHVTIG